MSGRDLTIATGTMFDKLRVLEGQPTHIVQQNDGLNRIRRMAHLRAIGKAEEKDGKLLLDENEWWKQLSDSEKEALRKAAYKVATMAPDGAAVDTLEYLKLEVGAISEDDE